jgi:hypothetical protein
LDGNDGSCEEQGVELEEGELVAVGIVALWGSSPHVTNPIVNSQHSASSIEKKKKKKKKKKKHQGKKTKKKKEKKEKNKKKK